ncbi:MAG TPA: DUF4388 domain-containing protein [Armatimonadota bacterium]|jgi:hypothetical protein
MAVKGTFKDISFTEFLQLMQLSRKTGRMEVTFDNKWAMVIFNEGVVWHVEPRGFGGAPPEEILLTLINTPSGNFTYQRVQVLPTLERSVNVSMETLILEGAKRLDDEAAASQEMAAVGSGQPNQMTQALKFKPGAEAKVRYVPQNVKRILQLIDGQRPVGEIIKQCQLEPAQAAQIIKELLAQDVVEMVDPGQIPEQAPAPSTAPA